LGIGLSIISGYGEAKDPDELIQKSPKAWQECVENREPAVDWLLSKYEQTLDLTTGPGKKAYSDIAMKIIGFLSDPVERAHYEQLVAKRLEVSVADLKQKKIIASKTRLKPIKTELKSDTTKALLDNILAIIAFGGDVGQGIDLELPEAEDKLAELEMIYEEKYAKESEAELVKEVQALWGHYQALTKEKEVEELSQKLSDADDEEKRNILRKITTLRKSAAR